MAHVAAVRDLCNSNRFCTWFASLWEDSEFSNCDQAKNSGFHASDWVIWIIWYLSLKRWLHPTDSTSIAPTFCCAFPVPLCHQFLCDTSLFPLRFSIEFPPTGRQPSENHHISVLVQPPTRIPTRSTNTPRSAWEPYSSSWVVRPRPRQCDGIFWGERHQKGVIMVNEWLI